MTDDGPVTTGEVQLISDGEGLAVIGEPSAVERFLLSAELTPSRAAGSMPQLSKVMGVGSATLQLASTRAATSGRWVKLTKESFAKVREFGLIPTKTMGVSHAIVGQGGKVKNWLQIESGVLNPALLSGVAGIMSQYAMQEAMSEIRDYLEEIDHKVDDILRSQKDAVLADMVGVDLVIEEAMTIRDHVGSVSEVTWSKVQATASTIARTQAYAIRQLDDLATKVELDASISDLADMTGQFAQKVQEWLAVIAHCCRLHDALGILELDRVLDASPQELEAHRVGLIAARQQRLQAIAEVVGQVGARMMSAADRANSKVILNPIDSPKVVAVSNTVLASLASFSDPLGLENGLEAVDTRRWTIAAREARERAVVVGGEAKDKALETGTKGVTAAKWLGAEGADRARSMTRTLRGKLAGRGASAGTSDATGASETALDDESNTADEA